jgi:hypothetical protein
MPRMYNLMFVSVYLCQFCVGLGFIRGVQKCTTDATPLPWWFDLHGVLFLAAEAAAMFVVAGSALLGTGPFVWINL